MAELKIEREIIQLNRKQMWLLKNQTEETKMNNTIQTFLLLHPYPPKSKGLIFVKGGHKQFHRGHEGFHYGLAVMGSIIINSGNSVDIVGYSDLNQLKFDKQFDWIFISTFSNQYSLICDTLLFISKKFPDSKVILGGVHASFAPETFKDFPYYILVRGEGEIFLKKLIDGKDYLQLPGVFKKEDKIKNEFAPIVRDLDSLPYAFRYMSLEQCNHRLDIVAQRGCIYNCSYCINMLYHKAYKNYKRSRTPENVIKEIENLQKGYDHLVFVDDDFLEDKEWSKELLEKYSKRCNLPFIIKVRPKLVNKEMLGMLKEAGCYRVQMGIEHGDYETRKKILYRDETDEEIINAFKLVKEFGIQTFSYNILGLPDDNEESILKIIELNRQVKPDHIYYTIFQPYPRTRLGEYAIEKGVEYPITESYFRWNAELRYFPELPGISKERLRYYFDNFESLIRQPIKDKYSKKHLK